MLAEPYTAHWRAFCAGEPIALLSQRLYLYEVDVVDRIHDWLDSELKEKPTRVFTSRRASGIASFKRCRPADRFHRSLRTEADYSALNDEIVRWQHEKKKGLKVEVNIGLTEKLSSNISSQETIDLTGPSPIQFKRSKSSQLSPPTSSLKKRSTATDIHKLRIASQRESVGSSGNNGPLVTTRWACKVQQCSNRSNWCWFPDGQDTTAGHHEFTALDLTGWSDSINDGKATVDTPRATLIQHLAIRKTLGNKKRAREEEKENQLPPQVPCNTTAPMAWPPWMYPQSPYQQPPPPQQPTPMPVQQEQGSSLVNSITPPNDVLHEFFEWLPNIGRFQG